MEVKDKRTGAEDVRWNLSDLYAGIDDPALNRDIDHTSEWADRFGETYRGKLATLDPEELLEAITEYETILEAASKIGAFAFLIWTTDTANPRYGALLQRVTEWGSQVQQKLVFFDLEWTNAPDDFAQQMMAHPVLAPYQHWLETTRRYQPHRLSEPEEKILAEKAVTGREAWERLFSEIMGSSRYPLDGEELTQEGILSKLFEPDRDVRQRAQESLTGVLREKLPILTFIFNTLAADKASDDRLRHYPTWISSRNLNNQVGDEVVEALVSAVTSRY